MTRTTHNDSVIAAVSNKEVLYVGQALMIEVKNLDKSDMIPVVLKGNSGIQNEFNRSVIKILCGPTSGNFYWVKTNTSKSTLKTNSFRYRRSKIWE